MLYSLRQEVQFLELLLQDKHGYSHSTILNFKKECSYIHKDLLSGYRTHYLDIVKKSKAKGCTRIGISKALYQTLLVKKLNYFNFLRLCSNLFKKESP